MRDILSALDKLQGTERENELRRVLGISDDLVGAHRSNTVGRRSSASRFVVKERSEDVIFGLASTIERVIRSDQNGPTGLEWEVSQI